MNTSNEVEGMEKETVLAYE